MVYSCYNPGILLAQRARSRIGNPVSLENLAMRGCSGKDFPNKHWKISLSTSSLLVGILPSKQAFVMVLLVFPCVKEHKLLMALLATSVPSLTTSQNPQFGFALAWQAHEMHYQRVNSQGSGCRELALKKDTPETQKGSIATCRWWARMKVCWYTVSWWCNDGIPISCVHIYMCVCVMAICIYIYMLTPPLNYLFCF